MPTYSTRLLTAVAINSIEMAPVLKARVEPASVPEREAQSFELRQLKLSKDIFRTHNQSIPTALSIAVTPRQRLKLPVNWPAVQPNPISYRSGQYAYADALTDSDLEVCRSYVREKHNAQLRTLAKRSELEQILKDFKPPKGKSEKKT